MSVPPTIETNAETLTRQVRLHEGDAIFSWGEEERRLPAMELPPKFIRWQLDYDHGT